MENKRSFVSGSKAIRIAACILAAVILFVGGGIIGWAVRPVPAAEPQPASVPTGNVPNPAYELLVGSAAWQMSAEAHALMMQAFHIAEDNVREMAELADAGEQGYSWVEEDGRRRLYRDGKQVCVICDIDDTMVDGVHYTANILGANGEWSNKAFTDFILSEGCTALPGAVEFANFCVENGVAIFYVSNRYDQGYKTSEKGYAGQEGYRKPDGTVIGASTYDLFGKTIYDISMESMAALGFPVNVEWAENYYPDAYLIVNDNKLYGESKDPIRQIIEEGGTLPTGERAQESTAYPAEVDISGYSVAMLLGDNLNDISQIFIGGADAVERVALAIEHMEKWGAEWIMLPNSVYGSSMNAAAEYGYVELFRYFDYTDPDSEAWDLYRQRDRQDDAAGE